jgi:hypothetical protein
LDSNIKEPIKVDLTNLINWPLIVTSANTDSYNELADFITQLGLFYDNFTMVVYDLGIERQQVGFFNKNNR